MVYVLETDEFLIATCGKGLVKPNAAIAKRVLQSAPQLPKVSVYCAAAAGDYPALFEFVESSPQVACLAGGLMNAPPLVYAASSILGKLECVALLLEKGGDPNSSWFTAEFPNTKLSCPTEPWLLPTIPKSPGYC